MLLQTHQAPLIHIDTQERVIAAVISTSVPDRRGDVVEPRGLINAEAFLKNPVVLWAHRRDIPPIGQCIQLEIQGERLIAHTRFSATSPLARELFELYREGVLRGWSIGFLPRSVRGRSRGRDMAGEPPRAGGLHYDRWELLEYSAVPVPENPQALTLPGSHGQAAQGNISGDVLQPLFTA